MAIHIKQLLEMLLQTELFSCVAFNEKKLKETLCLKDSKISLNFQKLIQIRVSYTVTSHKVMMFPLNL